MIRFIRRIISLFQTPQYEFGAHEICFHCAQVHSNRAYWWHVGRHPLQYGEHICKCCGGKFTLKKSVMTKEQQDKILRNSMNDLRKSAQNSNHS